MVAKQRLASAWLDPPVAALIGPFRDVRAALFPGASVTYSQSMTRSPTDSALMQRYRDGDTEAFEVLYKRHNDSLYRYLLRRCLDRDVAEDLFQEVWGKIIRSRKSYRPTAQFTTFLYHVAHNCFIDHVRRTRRRLAESQRDPDLGADPSPGPEFLAEKDIARKRLDVALQTLPDEQRDTFLLHEEAGFTIDTIAEITGVNRETAKSRLRYAVEKLRAALSEGTQNSKSHP